MPEDIETLDYAAFSERLFARSAAAKAPLRGQIELTYACNLRCVHCYTDCRNNPEDLGRELPTAEVLRLIDELAEAGCLWLCLTGGEIFMRPDFFKIYDHARSKRFLISLFSNATMITDAVADRLKAHPPFKIELSCHGATAATFDAVTRVPGSFERFCAGLRRLKDRGLRFELKAKAMTLNRHELRELERFVQSWGSPYRLSASIYPDLDGSLHTTAYRLSPEEIVALERREGVESEGDCARGEEPSDESNDSLYRCGCGTNTFVIDPTGRLGSCVWCREPGADLKSVSFAEGLAAHGAAVRGASFLTDSACASCRIYSQCGKNPGVAAHENGDAEEPVDHFCETAHRRAGKTWRI